MAKSFFPLLGMGILLTGFLACSPDNEDRGFWQGTWRNQKLQAQWTPAQPRIGDYVHLTLIFPGEAPDPRSLGGLPPVLLSPPGSLKYRHLVKRPGPFQPQEFSGVLWTVPNEEPGPWKDLRTWAVFPSPQPWPWGWILPALALITGGVFWKFRKTKPKSPDFTLWEKKIELDGVIPVQEFYRWALKALQETDSIQSGDSSESTGAQELRERHNLALYGPRIPPLDLRIQDLNLIKDLYRKKFREEPLV